MWNLFGSPQLANLFSLISLAVAFYKKKPPTENAAMTEHRRFPFSRRTMLIIIAVAFYGYGFYRTNQIEKQLSVAQAELEGLKVISAWGPSGATVNTAVLSRYQNKYNAMLIFRLEVRLVDFLNDPNIVKSYLFEINGGQRTVEVPPHDDAFWSRLTSSTGYVEIYTVLLPKAVSSDRIKCLADVKLNQGRIFNPRKVRTTLLLFSTKKNGNDTHKDGVPQTH